MSNSTPSPASTELVRWERAYTARRAIFSFLGAAFRLYGADGQLAFFVKQKAFKLKEDITVFGDESQTTPILRIKARSILDWGATYDVTDVATGETIGACKRERLKSFLRDEWTLLGADGQPIGALREDSLVMALIRRFVFKGFPQTFTFDGADGRVLGRVQQRFNPFQLAYNVQFEGIEPRLGVAAVVLLLAIEGRQA